jgi:hypothetical protein
MISFLFVCLNFYFFRVFKDFLRDFFSYLFLDITEYYNLINAYEYSTGIGNHINLKFKYSHVRSNI